MSFSVRFTEEGRKTLHELHIENQKRIKRALKNLANNLNLGKRLTGRLSGFYSLIVGKNRAIYTIEKEAITVHYAGHRENVYDNFEEIKNLK